MSIHANADHDGPRFEPWLGIMLASMVPGILMQLLPPQFLVPLIAAVVILVLTSLLMLRRQIVQRRTPLATTGRLRRSGEDSLDGAASDTDEVLR